MMKRVFKQIKKHYTIVPIDIALCLILIVFSPYFLSASNFDSLMTSIAPVGIISIGMVMLLISGNFDLSVGSTMNLGAFITTLIISGGGNLGVALLAGIGVGIVVGLINGCLVAYAKVNPLITTIGTMNIVKGIADLLNADKGLYSAVVVFPHDFVMLGTGQIAGIYFSFLLMILLGLLLHLVLKRTNMGRNLYYIGGNVDAAKQMGIKVNVMMVGTYVITGLLAALAGIFATARLQMATRFLGEDTNMTVLISCIIGGASMAGGKGRVFGALCGAAFSSLITNAFNLFEINTLWQKVVLGFVLMVVVTIDGYTLFKEQRRLGKI